MRDLYDLVNLLIKHQALIDEAFVWGLSTGGFLAEEAESRRILMDRKLIDEGGRFPSDRLRRAIEAVIQKDQPVSSISQTEWQTVASNFLAG